MTLSHFNLLALFLLMAFAAGWLLARLMFARSSSKDKAKPSHPIAIDQAKSRYFTAISHELRTPLNSMLGYAQILADAPDIPPQHRQAVKVIRQSGDHLLSVIESTLDIARIEGGKLSLEPSIFSFTRFMDELLALFSLQARQQGIEFLFYAPHPLPSMVRADQRRLRQILINVLGNAIKFTQQGKVSLTLNWRYGNAEFTIEDTGCGIPADELDIVFEPFSRASNATASGSGIGLTMAQMLTHLMGGEMAITSKVGQGTKCHLHLFLTQVHGEHQLTQPPVVLTRRILGYTGNRRRILIVDNEMVERELQTQLLSPLGFEVIVAESGEHALAFLTQQSVDLVLMDLGLPGIDGWETIRRIRQWHKASPNQPSPSILIVSANAFDRHLENDVGISAEDFFVKPINVQALLDAVSAKLALTWIYETEKIEPIQAAKGNARPPASLLIRLQQQVEQGYIRGIHQELAIIEQSQPIYQEWVKQFHEHAMHFQFPAMRAMLEKSVDQN
jgi:CheY-like chemotaxis protein/nitrogen-specific signal transduction histidine kinase